MTPDYAAFLDSKTLKAPQRGLAKVPALAPHLYPFQAHAVDFALRAGSSGCFLDTGLGKTEVQLEFCQKAIEASNAPAILWTPLAVAAQTRRRAERWGYEARVIREQSEAKPGIINICNYDRRDKIDAAAFPVVSCDEASILKSFTGSTTREMTAAHRGALFKMVATATPAPNDHMEIGQYAGFLEVMASNEMLMRWFITDQAEMGRYRLKSHAVVAFWDWMASWTRLAEKPSDLTGNPAHDVPYHLSPFEIVRHQARDGASDRDFAGMFGAPALSATNLHDVKRQTAVARAEAVAEAIAADPDEAWLIWCDTNYEADALFAAVPDVIEVRGSQSIDLKEELLEAFGSGQAKRLIAKPSMCGYGLDWSHVNRMAFAGRNFSYETWYQAVRRAWRFGRKGILQVHLAVAQGEGEIGRVIDRKADDHASMKLQMREAMKRASGAASALKVPYLPTHTAKAPEWLKSAA